MATAHDPHRLADRRTAARHGHDGDDGESAGAQHAKGPTTTAPGGDGDTGNHLLSLVGRAEWAALAARAQTASFVVHDVLFDAGDSLTHVFFPLSGEFSIVRKLANGAKVEVATVGREGMVWLDAFLGDGRATPLCCFTQLPGSTLRLPVADFAELAREGTRLHAVLRRYAQVVVHQMAQTVVCNRLHSVEQRCARWLLMTHDRAPGDRFSLTQEFLAAMLGVRRAGVTVAEGKLRRAGLIDFTRGYITVTNRAGLEEASCECYRTDAEEYTRLLGGDPASFAPGDGAAATAARGR